jgi:hypothetical protein
MPKEFLEDRKKALEDSFFAKENEKLLEQLRAKQRKKAARDGLAEVSGVSDPAVLDQLVELDIEPVTWTAISLIPLVEIAWADGRMDEKERRAVLAAAEANGVFVDSPSHALLQGWLERRPDGRLFQTWGEYIVHLCAKLGEPEKQRLKAEILGRARSVAEATGGILGMGNKVSPEEAVILAELEKAFEG